MQGTSITIVCRFDSFTRIGLAIADLFLHECSDVFFYVIDPQYSPKNLVKEVKCRCTNSKFHLRFGFPSNIPSPLIFLSLTGAFIKRFVALFATELASEKRPLLITSFPGLSYQNVYDGLASRSLCDLILFNNLYEYRRYLEFVKKYGLKDCGFIAGFFSNFDSNLSRGCHCKDFIFSEQVTAPNTKLERKYLARKLIDFSMSIQEHGNLYVKPRLSDGGKAIFQTKLNFVEALNASSTSIPRNLILTNNSVFEYIQQGASSLTVSSTVGIETLEFHNRSYFIQDFGPSEQVGSDYFASSGSYLFLDELIEGRRCEVNKVWAREHYQLFSHDAFFNVIYKLISSGERNGLHNARKLFSMSLLKTYSSNTVRRISWFRGFLFAISNKFLS